MDRLVLLSFALSFTGLAVICIAAPSAAPLKLPDESQRFTATAMNVTYRGTTAFLTVVREDETELVYFPLPNQTIAPGTRIRVVARKSSYRGRLQWVAEEIRDDS